MVFSSTIFILYFLPLTLFFYFLARILKKSLANDVLLVASYLFYATANPAFLPLLLFSTLVDFVAARGIEADRRHPAEARRGFYPGAKAFLVTSIVVNLAVLGFFKYFNFGIETYNVALETLAPHLPAVDDAIAVTLPLGISFYTFQSMSYTIDVYRGKIPAERRLRDFALFVSLFPQLVAGPILRYGQISDDLKSRHHSIEQIGRGVTIFILGFAKKVLLANPCGEIADAVFATVEPASLDAWFGLLAFSFQIYFDFGGYSDMAIGLGCILGFTLPRNFDSPYRARSVSEFWRRWHMTLSCWLRDYVFVPLGGSRGGVARTCTNLLIVMVLAGLWHGAAWTFVAWGLFHGLLLVAERLWQRAKLPAIVPVPLQPVLTFAVVTVGWVLFRARDFDHAVDYARGLLFLNAPPPESGLAAAIIYSPYALASMGIAALVVWTAPQSTAWAERLSALKVATAVVLLALSLLVMNSQAFRPFIYFFF